MIALLAAALTCISPHVVDGDTFRCTGETVRIWGIDAPESRTPDGPRSTLALENLVRNQAITCIVPPSGQVQDRYRRAVRQCFVNGQDVAAEMVRGGFARDLPRYSRGFYAEAGR